MSAFPLKSRFLFLVMLMLGLLEHGQGAARPFTRRFTADIAGDIVQIGNTNMTAPAGAAGDAARNGTGSSLNNNDFSMVFVDTDSDSTTFNSSSATLTLPTGARVLFAGLYWGSDTATGSGVTAAPNAAIRTQVLFSTPGSGYTTRTSTIDDSTSGYSCFSDVTTLVSNAGAGSYTVANIQGSRTTNRFSGWALVVAYSEPGAPPRNLSIFDGHQLVNSGTTSVNIAISGFRTPANGAVRTHIGAVVMEGDLGLTGDTMTLNGTNIPSPADPQNPSTNVFNSTITRLGTRLSAKTPDYINQLGWDVDDFSANGVLANNATSATINVTTGGETYMPIMISFATDLYAPQITAPKSVVDLNGDKINPGDILEYTIAIRNNGGDSANSLVMTDPIPANTTYVPGSLQVSVGAGAGPKTDAMDGDLGEFDAAQNRVVVRLGTGANATQGGMLAIGESTAVKFQVRVNNGTANGARINNQSSLSYSSLATGVVIASASTASSVLVQYELEGKVFTDNGAGGGTANDGILNGGETGGAGAVVRLLSNNGATTHAIANVAGDGRYRLSIPVSVPTGTVLLVRETNAPNTLSTGGSAGTTGGVYARAQDEVTFTLGSGSPLNGAVYGGVNFGDVPVNILLVDGQQAGLPGTAVVYSHRFTAGSAGSVTFTTANVASPTLAGWSQTLFRDLNNNATLDANEPAITGPLTVIAGEVVSILVKEFIPAAAPLGARDRVTLTATFNYTGSAPVLSSAQTRVDLTTVGTPGGTGLILMKSVNRPTARPGETLTYTIEYSNRTSEPLTTIVINDTTPAFSTFTSATNGPLPDGLTGVVLSAPSPGASGAVQWTFAGNLPPGASGTVSFTITLEQ